MSMTVAENSTKLDLDFLNSVTLPKGVKLTEEQIAEWKDRISPHYQAMSEFQVEFSQFIVDELLKSTHRLQLSEEQTAHWKARVSFLQKAMEQATAEFFEPILADFFSKNSQ